MVERERFVPRRLSEITDELCRMPWPCRDDGASERRFRSFARLTSALYHYEFHDREQALSDAWEHAGDDPDAATELSADLTGLLDGANYVEVTTAELEDALHRESLVRLRLEIDFEDYDEVSIYRRGSRRDEVEIPRWMGLRSETRRITVDERVVVHARVKDQGWFDDRGVEPADLNLVPGHVSLKQFQNVPRADIEMLLPSAQVRMRPIDTLVVGVPAVVSGLVALFTKLLPTLGLIVVLVAAWLGLRDQTPTLDQTSLVVLFGGTVALGAFVFRQWSKLKNRRLEYLKTLSENLYVRTLGDGPGVIHTLLASAEEQEVLEVLLAYRFLMAAPDGLTAPQLDRRIEEWLDAACDRDVDFEVDDALAKLDRLGALDGDIMSGDAMSEDTMLRARPLDEVLAALDRRWDDLFQLQPGDLDGSAADATVGDTAGDAADDVNEHRAARPLVRLRRVVERFRGRLGDRRPVRETDPS